MMRRFDFFGFKKGRKQCFFRTVSVCGILECRAVDLYCSERAERKGNCDFTWPNKVDHSWISLGLFFGWCTDFELQIRSFLTVETKRLCHRRIVSAVLGVTYGAKIRATSWTCRWSRSTRSRIHNCMWRSLNGETDVSLLFEIPWVHEVTTDKVSSEAMQCHPTEFRGAFLKATGMGVRHHGVWSETQLMDWSGWTPRYWWDFCNFSSTDTCRFVDTTWTLVRDFVDN